MLDTPKVPLALAAQNLATLMEVIDNNGDLEAAIIRLFSDARLDVASAVDRRICFFDIGERNAEALRDISRKYAQAAKQLEDALEAVKRKTLEIMKGLPEMPYKGDLGRLSVQKNSSASCNILIETKKVSFANALDLDDIEDLKINPGYYEERTYYVLILEKIKAALEAGHDIPWAELKRGEHLRVYRK